MQQDPVACHLAWGRRGARQAARDGHVLVVVDVLSFSTAVAVAVSQGAAIYPCALDEDIDALAREAGAEIARRRAEAPALGRFSLSPATFLAAEPGTRIALASPNGATCVRLGGGAAQVFTGALVNARATAAAAYGAMLRTGRPISIVPCGERLPSPDEDGPLRFAVEDYLGAGAIIAGLPAETRRSPDATVCEAAFRNSAGAVADLLLASESGRELIAIGFRQDVELAGRLDRYAAAAVLRGRRFERAT